MAVVIVGGTCLDACAGTKEERQHKGKGTCNEKLHNSVTYKTTINRIFVERGTKY